MPVATVVPIAAVGATASPAAGMQPEHKPINTTINTTRTGGMAGTPKGGKDRHATESAPSPVNSRLIARLRFG
ncbi:MAG: hypothetical protein HC826_02405 [Rhodospirillales bacterium]|nr:hypothetical protein [Rhodospirillales bacterium]